MIGTVTIPKKDIQKSAPESWGRICEMILSRMRHSPTKAASRYYYPTIYNYFDGIYTWLLEMRKLLKERAPLFIVVQTSYFKNFEIPVGEIFLEMGRNMGYETQKVRRQSVRTHMGLLSPQQRKRAPDKILHEEVLVLRLSQTQASPASVCDGCS
jgi:hypothetical protein